MYEIETDGARWDETLLELGGSLMQSWRWGEYKQGQGWRTERVRVSSGHGTAMAQVLFRHGGPTSFAYVPHGPVIRGEGAPVFRQLVAALDTVCRRHRAATLVLEPAKPLPLCGRYSSYGFVRGPAHSQVVSTIKVPLGSDDELLAQMRKKTRYGVRLGQRRGVSVQRADYRDSAALATFYGLVGETAKRHDFPLRSQAYYREVLRLFGDDAALLIASVDGEAVATEVVVAFGEDGNSLYAGSSTSNRVNGATAYLEYEILRWARDHGCRYLDLWGTEWVGMPDDGAAFFKLGFGGEVLTYPPTLERRYSLLLSWAMRWALARYHASVT